MSLYKRVETSPLPLKPYSLSNSGLFEGDDGLWSTFFINIGDSDGTGSGQNFRILPSTSSPTTLIPRQAEWCTNDCPKLRGIGLVDGRQPEGVVNSRTWQEKTILEMPTPWGWSAARMTDTWNSTPAGLLGTDNLGLGESSAQSPVLTQQYMMQYTVKDFFLGSLGLAAGAFGPQGASIPNFINNFYASTIPYIASRSYGYTAGAYYRKLVSNITNKVMTDLPFVRGFAEGGQSHTGFVLQKGGFSRSRFFVRRRATSKDPPSGLGGPMEFLHV